MWREWLPAAQDEFKTTYAKWLVSGNQDQRPLARMQDGDAENFLKLAASLKIILGRTVRRNEIGRAQKLLRAYLEVFQEVRFLLFSISSVRSNPSDRSSIRPV
jgi:hypothetical protein